MKAINFNMASFRAECIKRRKDRKLTYRKIHEKCGLPDYIVHKFEHGKVKHPKVDTILNLALFYGISLWNHTDLSSEESRRLLG